MAEQRVFVLSGARTDFKNKWTNLQGNVPGAGSQTVYSAIDDVVHGAIRGAPENFNPDDISNGVAYIAFLESAAFSRQGHFPAVLGTSLKRMIPGYKSMPIIGMSQNACCSSGAALHEAYLKIATGQADVAMVVGLQQMRSVKPTDVGPILAVGMDQRTDNVTAPAHSFAELTRKYMETYGLSVEAYDLAAGFAVANDYAHANNNALAQMRDNTVTREFASGVHAPVEDSLDPQVKRGNLRFDQYDPRFYPLKRLDFSQVTDGAAALILVSERYARNMGLQNGVALVGSSLQTDALSLTDKLVDGKVPEYFNGFYNATHYALNQAGLGLKREGHQRGPHTMGRLELYDCFPITLLLILEHLGFAKPGEAFNLGTEFWEEMGPKINTSGGLLGDGHPIGAAVLRMVYGTHQHLIQNRGTGMVTAVGDIFGSNYVAVLRYQEIK